MCGHTRDPIIYSKFHRNPFRGFGAPGGQNLAFPITLASRFYNSLYYRTSRDSYKRAIHKNCCTAVVPVDALLAHVNLRILADCQSIPVPNLGVFKAFGRIGSLEFIGLILWRAFFCFLWTFYLQHHCQSLHPQNSRQSKRKEIMVMAPAPKLYRTGPHVCKYGAGQFTCCEVNTELITTCTV